MKNETLAHILISTIIVFCFIVVFYWKTILIIVISWFNYRVVGPVIDSYGLLFKSSNKLIEIKLYIKILKYLTNLSYIYDIITIHVTKDVDQTRLPKETRRRITMAVRSIDSTRVHRMVFEVERRRKDDDGNYVMNDDGTYSLMSHEEAASIAAQNDLTVVLVRPRTARQQANERDQMIEVHSRKGEIVQRIATGSMDMSALLSCVVGWERMLPPLGKCSRCGVEHTEEYLDFNKLVSSSANSGATPSNRTEICIDHLSEDQRAEVLAFIRNMGEEQVGEG